MCYPEYLKIVQSINILLKYIQSKWRQGCFNMLIIYWNLKLFKYIRGPLMTS